MILNKPGLLRDKLKLLTQCFLLKFERFLIDQTAGLCFLHQAGVARQVAAAKDLVPNFAVLSSSPVC